MDMNVRCEGCGKRYRVKRSLEGKRTKCKGCGAMMVLTDEAAAPEVEDLAAWRDLENAASPAPAEMESAPAFSATASAARVARGDYVDLPGEEVIDRVLPWVAVALFVGSLG